MGLQPTRASESRCHPEPFVVTLSEAKGLQFHLKADQCRFFASLRMTDFQESPDQIGALLSETKEGSP